MTNSHALPLHALDATELESITGGSTPAYWWLFLYAVSESQSFVDGFRAGYNA